MISELKSIKGLIQQIVEAVSAIIKLEIHVFDLDRNIVAGTSYAREQVGIQYKGTLTRQSIETGNIIVARSPGHCQECLTCKKFRDCIYYYVIASPLFVKDKVLGSFCLSAVTEEQKQSFLNNEKNLVDFLNRMCALIVSPIKEIRIEKEFSALLKRYYNVADIVQEGLITADNSGRIIDINLSAAELLNLNAEQVTKKSFLSLFPDFNMPLTHENPLDRELLYMSKRGTRNFLSTVIPITGVNSQENRRYIISLRNPGKIQSHTPSQYVFDDIIGNSPALLQIKEKLKKAALTDSSILIYGESGTGKEMLAQAVHSASKRSRKNFITINCSAIPDMLMESELFGYEEGAFTGARKGGKAGKFELAQGGTIFLDEIGEMPLHHQSKLLRVLENRVIERVGGIKPIEVDVRVITATNKSLEQLLENGKFRRDLFYRLNVIPVYLPPLRDRVEDIELLANYFLARFTAKFDRPRQILDPSALSLLNNYFWPGNIRELENTIEYAVNISEPGEVLTLDHLPQRIHSNIINRNKKKTNHKNTLKEMKRKAIQEAVSRFGNTTEGKKRAAAYLGISLSTIKRQLKNN